MTEYYLRFNFYVVIFFITCNCRLLAQVARDADTILQQEITDTLMNENDIAPIHFQETLVKEQDTFNNKKRKYSWRNLPFYLDDIMVIGGVNISGIYMSKDFRNLSHRPGFNVGLESYFPVLDHFFFNYGIQYAQKNFRHESYAINFRNHYIDIPLFFAYELPEFNAFDWRFMLGYQLSFRLNSTQSQAYPEEVWNNENAVVYPVSGLHRVDPGFVFGTSAEFRSCYVRFKGFTGFTKLVKERQGMINAFHFEFGFFIFRNLRRYQE